MEEGPMIDQNPTEEELREAALEWWQRGYMAQMGGSLEQAIELYTRSIETWPTAEAYTFRGWAKSYQGLIDQAIEECHKAIEIDPDYGNPYNDIGAYLIQKGDLNGAIPWLKRALQAQRYECYFYPHFNLGRIYEHRGDLREASKCYKAAYDANHKYTQALVAFHRVQGKLN
jgi:tetratricopeptide (TPR) repeat protein